MNYKLFIAKFFIILIGIHSFISYVFADQIDLDDWPSIVDKGREQTVYWNAWAGEPLINNYIAWVADEVKSRFDITLVHVKISDTAEAVGRVVAEKAAGRMQDGSVDLIWINGENFIAMKNQGLLLTPAWATKLPNYTLVDYERKPTITNDFSEPVDGLESPWGMAQIVFYYDRAVTQTLPQSMKDILAWAKKHPGRFTYPQPPSFLGSAFLKQALYAFVDDPKKLQKPVIEGEFKMLTAPLFDWLDALHPHLWRRGRTFAQNSAAMRRLLADGEIEIAFTFNPGDPSSAIKAEELPDTVRSFVLESGSLANTHFVTIPFNAKAKAGALVVANFLLSPLAQAHKQDPNIWGDPTVLAMDKLKQKDQTLFNALDLGQATLSGPALGMTLAEPHSSWMAVLEKAWKKRYGVQ